MVFFEDVAARKLARRFWAAICALRGGNPGRPGAAPVLWLHAVSVGEVGVCLQLMRALEPRLPAFQFVVSTTTSTGMGELRRRLPPHIRPFIIRWTFRASCGGRWTRCGPAPSYWSRRNCGPIFSGRRWTATFRCSWSTPASPSAPSEATDVSAFCSGPFSPNSAPSAARRRTTPRV